MIAKTTRNGDITFRQHNYHALLLAQVSIYRLQNGKEHKRKCVIIVLKDFSNIDNTF